jgi:hypothetical protein
LEFYHKKWRFNGRGVVCNGRGVVCASFGSDVKVEFKTQLKGDSMLGIIREVLREG